MSLLHWSLLIPCAIACTSGLLAEPLPAQEPLSVTAPLPPAPLTKEQIENPPARELTVEQQAEPLKRPLNHPQPALVEQKFVAIVQFVVSPVSGDPDAVDNRSKLYYLQRMAETSFLSPSAGGRPPQPRLAADLQRLIEHVPEELLAKSASDFFRSAEVDIGFVTLMNNARHQLWSARPSSDRDAEQEHKTIQGFLGKTAAECEQRSRALVTIFDQGFSRPLQLELLEQRNYHAEDYRKRQQEYIQIEESLPGLKKSLAEFADLSNDMLTGLRLQQRDAEIKLAGVRARLAAAEKLLTKARADGTRRTQRHSRRSQLI